VLAVLVVAVTCLVWAQQHSLEEKKAREEAERQQKLADDRAAVEKARREEEAAQAAALRAKMTEKERQEQSKRDNEARQKVGMGCGNHFLLAVHVHSSIPCAVQS
jgi:septal ring factor EnvC (AmiA/AmiB activator)